MANKPFIMKPTTISPETKKTELIVLTLCFIAAILFNIFSIIIYKTSWKELFTQIHVVIIVTFGFYIILLFFRVLTWLFLRLFKKK